MKAFKFKLTKTRSKDNFNETSITQNRYTATSRATISLLMKHQQKLKLKSFRKVLGKRRQKLIKMQNE